MTFCRDTLTIYRRDTLEKRLPFAATGVRKIIFDDYRHRIFVMAFKWLYSVSAQNGSVGLKYFAPTGGSEFVDLDYSPDKAYLAVGIEFPINKSFGKPIGTVTSALRVLTPEGIELPMYHVMGKSSRRGYPKVQFSREGYSVIIIAADQIERVSWPR